MDKTRQRIKVCFAFLIWFSGFLVAWAQRTNAPCEKVRIIKTPESISQRANTLLSTAGKDPLEPRLPKNRKTSEFRVVTFQERLEIDEKHISHARKSSWDVVILNVLVPWASYTNGMSRVEHLRFPFGKEHPEILYAKECSWDRKRTDEWFNLLWEGEVFSLPPSRNLVVDEGNVRCSFTEVCNDIYIEKITGLEYVLIKREWDEGSYVIEAILDKMREWYPDADIPKAQK